MFKANHVPMGKSVFVTWSQIDNAFDTWAKDYFGEHVTGQGERDGTDCYIKLSGLSNTDWSKFSQLYEKYDKDHEYDAFDDLYGTNSQMYSIDNFEAVLPDCISRAVISEVFKSPDMNSIGTVLSIEDGVYFMENGLNQAALTIDHPIAVTSADSKQISVTLNIDEDIIIKASGQPDLASAISQELGWLYDSGLTVESWSFAEPDYDRGQRLINELLNYLGDHLDSSEIYRILHDDLEMSRDDISILGFDLPQCSENKDDPVVAKPSLESQIQSAFARAGGSTIDNAAVKALEAEH